MQVVQKKGSRRGARVLIRSPVHQMQRSLADSPLPPTPGLQKMKSGHLRPELKVSLGPPASAPPPRRPLPQCPALPPTWRSARRGEGAAVSSHSRGPRGRDCTPNLPPPRGLASLLLFCLPSPRAQSPLFSRSGSPPRGDSSPCRRPPGFQTGVCPHIL